MRANYYWIKQGSEYIGPFDTQRDALIAAKTLERFADWLDWSVVAEEAS